ncbi:MAG: SGNH/GDSL hydrolase family protein [Clostridia bacterium]|nr:SGNH/GDSL hydrolase family protein [Clostridia bacterium]
MKAIRLLTILLILSLVLSVFSACGDNETASTDTSSTPESTEAPVTTPEEEPAAPVDPLLAEIVEHMQNDPNYLIFVIGDSLTEGQGASDPKRSDYTAKFAEKIAERMPNKNVYRVDGKRNNDATAIIYPNKGKHVPVQRISGVTDEIVVARCGIGGNTVKRIINRSYDFIGKELRGTTGDLFIIMSGINDAASGNIEKYASPPAYKKQLNELIDMIYAEHPEADIILMTPTFVGSDGSGLDMYAKQMKDIAAERQIALIDQHQLWLDHYEKGSGKYNQGDWLSDADSCHPTDIGHEAMADYMIKCLFGK